MSSFTPTKVPQMLECRKERKRRTYRKSNQRTHRTHTTKKHPEVSTNAPRSFANTTIAHSKFLMCIDAKFPHTPICTPKFHNALKSKVSDYLKRPSKFRDVYPSPPTDTLQFLNLQNHLSKSQKVKKQHPEFLYTHEIWEFLTIQRPQCTRPNPHALPRSLSGSLIASKIPTFQWKNSHLGGLDRPPPAPPRTGGNPSVCVPKNA